MFTDLRQFEYAKVDNANFSQFSLYSHYNSFVDVVCDLYILFRLLYGLT